MFLKFMGIRSEPKWSPTILQSGFLTQLSRPGLRYRNVATLRELIPLADPQSGKKLAFGTLELNQAARLRKNLLDHEELPLAIQAAKEYVEKYPKGSKQRDAFLQFLDGLSNTLKESFEELSKQSGENEIAGAKHNKRKQELLKGVFIGAFDQWVLGQGKSVAALVQARLSKIDGKPAPESAPPLPKDKVDDEPAPLSSQTHAEFRTLLAAYGTIGPAFVELLLRDASQILEANGIRGTDDDIGRHVDNFEKADSATRNRFLVDLTESLLSKDHLGIQLALGDLDEATEPLGRVSDLKTFTTPGRQRVDGEPTSQFLRARFLIHDIARGFPTVSDYDLAGAVRAALGDAGVTKHEAAAFMKYAGALQLEGRSRIVREMIAEHAEGKF
jgi:hypothetical protein